MDDLSHVDQAKALVRKWVAMFNAGDFSVAEEIAADTYVEHATAPFGSAEPGSVPGPSHLRTTSDWLLAQFPDLSMRIEALIAEGDLVAARIASAGTNEGPLNGGLAATRRRFSAAQTHWFRVRDGRLAEHWATRDDLTAMVQLGIVSAPGGMPRSAGAEETSATYLSEEPSVQASVAAE
jgi:predicted ester cyclase